MKGKKLKLQRKGKCYHLEDSALYKITSKKKLSEVLFIKQSDLVFYQSDSNYDTFYKDKEGGKKRLIECPKKKLDMVHTRIASLLCRIATPDYLHSGTELRSNVTNAKGHIGFHPVFTTDVTSFFPSTTHLMVFNFFYKKLKCSSDVANILANICTFKNHVPTGSRISMPIAFWANFEMFENLRAFADSRSVRMTIYVDDLTFSGAATDVKFAYNVKKIISQYNHIAHPEKSKLYRATDPKLITGVIIHGDKIKVRNKLLKNIHQDFREWNVLRKINTLEPNTVGPKLIGRMNAASSIDIRFKDKLRSFKLIT